jgi:iron complex outermembrane receptor protein
MNTPMRRLTPVIMAVLGAVIAAEPILAADSDELQEIVVTARKREETLQNVPVTEDAFTQQTIQSAGIESPRDFVAMVPNMTLVETQNVGNSFITIRGISQARNSEPSTAVLVDGVLEPNPYEFDQELFDITQIEVLKGPQGALYGRDAIGGAIIIQTADLADHFEGDGKVGVGNGVSEKAQLAVSGPIDDAGTLRYRASLNFYNTDGYLENTNLDRKADPYRDYSGRLRLVWKPNDQWTADLRAYRDRVDTTAYYYVIPRADEANPFSSFTTPPNANDITSPIQDQNLGSDYRDITDLALKLDYHIGLRHVHLGLGLQLHQGDRHRRRLRLPADQGLHRLQLFLRGHPRCRWRACRREPEPVHLREDRKPGAALYLQQDERLLVDRRRLFHSHPTLHLHR